MENSIIFCYFLNCGVIFSLRIVIFFFWIFVFKCKDIYLSYMVLDFVVEMSEKFFF